MNFDDDEETIAVDMLLDCSDRKENSLRCMDECSWDEICSWKSVVAPMCISVKPKRKKEIIKKKKKMHFADSLNNDSENKFEYRHRLRNLAHSSTNVLSYNSPSSRNIIDMKTYNYLEREHLEKFSNYLIRENSQTLIGSCGYNIQINDGSIIDNKLFLDIKNGVYLYNVDENNGKLHNNTFCKGIRQPKPLSLMDELQLTIKPISLANQSQLTTKVAPDKDYDSITTQQKYKNVDKKYKKRRQDIFKISTYLPSITGHQNKTDTTSSVVDESEEEIFFPFRITHVPDGKNVTQNINIDKLTTSIMDETSFSHCTKEKVEDTSVLPPIAGLHIS